MDCERVNYETEKTKYAFSLKKSIYAKKQYKTIRIISKKTNVEYIEQF